MSFFNLTHTGVQDPFKTASCGTEHKSKAATCTSAATTAATEDSNTQPNSQSQSQQPQASATVSSSSSLSPPSHVQTMYSPTETGQSGSSWHRGSHYRYTEHLRKHQRHPQGPTELYQQPVSTSQDYGWWMKEGTPQKEKWAQSERHAHVNSEMTQFVDDMSLTNKEFSLF